MFKILQNSSKLNYFLSLLTIFVFISYYSSYLIAGVVTLISGIILYFNPKLLNSSYLQSEKNGFIIVSAVVFIVLGVWYLLLINF